MTKEDTAKILTVLRLAYPNFYKGLTQPETQAVISLWHSQLGHMPYDIVSMAISKIIATNTFPPAIAEVKDKIKYMYTEAVVGLLDDNISAEKKETLRRIERSCRCMNDEPSLMALLNGRMGRVAITDETHDKHSS